MHARPHATPLAKSGDYYLFDSTGFTLVRPSQKTFSSFAIADHEFSFENRRNGWPSEFVFRADGSIKLDTLGAKPIDARVIRHETAHGRLAVADAPPGEGGIARWIGPTEALADMARRGAIADERNVELMNIAPLEPPQQSAINLSQRQNIQCFRQADIDLAKLVLPSDFSETAWPGFQNEPGLPILTEKAAAKWRTVPRGE